jgi:hypothetical protein
LSYNDDYRRKAPTQPGQVPEKVRIMELVKTLAITAAGVLVGLFVAKKIGM